MSIAPPAKRRRLTPPGESGQGANGHAKSSKEQQKDFARAAGKWNLEQDYEVRNRKNKRKEKESTRLPIKTREGRVERYEEPESVATNAHDTSAGPHEPRDDDAVSGSDEEPEVPRLTPKQEILEAKEELAKVAAGINEAPDENIGRLKRLAEIGQSKNTTVKKLALATQMTVYKDLIPGYRIRPWGESETSGRLTKEVKAQRNFEQTLVSSYQGYVQVLQRLAKSGTGGQGVSQTGLASIAITCVTELLLAVPHFNFRGELLRILVDKLSGRNVDDDFRKCLKTIETIFAEDDDGQPSLDAVTMLTQMMKGRDWHVHEEVLNLFLHLRLLTEFSLKASQNRVDKADPEAGKPTKKKREFRTKKERKALKELKAVSKEFKEADAVVSREERDRLQAETLKLVFSTYFRILKARSSSLMGAVLEGLAKYAHLINQDFFGDILEVLRELSGQAIQSQEYNPHDDSEDEEAERITWSDPQRAILLCTTTAFELLSGQDAAKNASALSLDLSYFTSTLYRILPQMSLSPDLELSLKSLAVASQQTMSGMPAKVNQKATAALLVRGLTATLMQRATPQARVAAFAHRLENSALHVPERSATALLGVMNQVSKVHGRKIAGLWDSEERRGDGTFIVGSDDLDGANPFAGNIWAGELLKLHYAPDVREGLVNLEKGIIASKGRT